MKTVTVLELHRFLLSGRPGLVLDVRTPLEYAEAHVSQAHSVPLDTLDPQTLYLQFPQARTEPVYLLCRSGQRATRAAERFAQAGYVNAVVVQGGTVAWIQAGLPVWRAPGRLLGLEQQVRIGAGLLVLLGVALGRWVDESFLGLTALVGLGLVFAGMTDRCGFALLLSRAPWNRRRLA